MYLKTKHYIGVFDKNNPLYFSFVSESQEAFIVVVCQEFLGMMKQKANEADQESDLREAFKIFDRDKDGFIDLKELKTVATMLGSMLTKEEVEEFMREADVVSLRV